MSRCLSVYQNITPPTSIASNKDFWSLDRKPKKGIAYDAFAVNYFLHISSKVTSPGTWLPKREDIYLSVSLFGHVRRTRAVACTFPLHFNDCLRFDKVRPQCHRVFAVRFFT